jgi:septum formation protein
MSDRGVILASGSAIRAAMLKNAGVAFAIERPRIDEEALKQSLRMEGLSPRDQADALAEAKAVSVSRRMPGFVIGADQILALGSEAFDKPTDRDVAAVNLRKLRGQTHVLHSAIVVAKDGVPIWRHLESPKLAMRDFSEAFLQAYLDEVGEAVLYSVGAYQLEGRGIQLFAKIEGDFFSILGLPLVPLLSFLRVHGVVAQ